MKTSRAILAVCLLLAAVTAVTYAPVARHQFINYDDNCYVTNNRHVQAGLTWEGVAWAFGQIHGERTYWHPLTWVSHMLDCQLFGLNPAGHHLVNLLLHTVNTLLVFLVFWRMTGALWRCAVLAGLFALHPLQVDTVAWVAERKNLLSAMFWLLSTWAYGAYAQSAEESKVLSLTSKVGDRGPQSAVHGSRFTFHASCITHHPLRNYALSLLFFALGLMCKPVLVTLPFVLLLLDYWPLGRVGNEGGRMQAAESRTTHCAPRSTLHALLRLAWKKWPFFLLAAASCLITILGHRGLGSLGGATALPAGLRLENAIVSYVRYLGKTLVPMRLAILYPYPGAWPMATVTLCALLLLAITAFAIAKVRRHPYLFVGWFWFLGVLVPFIGLVQAGEQAMADRFMYIPILGLLVAAVWGLDALLQPWVCKQQCLAAAGALALTGCLIGTWLQLRHWQDSETLFRHAIEVTADNYNAYDGLGSALEAKGKTTEALAAYSEAVRLKPRYPDGQYDLGTTLMRQGRLDEAVRHLAAAIEANPAFAHAHINLGKALLEQGKQDQAAAHFAQAVRLTPDDTEAQYNQGTLLLMEGSLDPAIAAFSEALCLNPDYSEAHGNLGIAFMRQGKSEQGAPHFAAAVKLNPGNPEAHDNLGLAFLELNRPREAADQFSEALRLNPDSPGPHYHLALALLQQDKPQDALPHARKARDLAKAAGQTALAAKAEALLSHQP